MNRSSPSLVLALAAMAFAAPPALAQGKVGVMTRGLYVCEIPNDDQVSGGIRQPEQDFAIEGGSHYGSALGGGLYLRRGDVLSFTSGARKGEVYSVESEGFVRRMDEGKPGRLRCVRLGR